MKKALLNFSLVCCLLAYLSCGYFYFDNQPIMAFIVGTGFAILGGLSIALYSLFDSKTGVKTY